MSKRGFLVIIRSTYTYIYPSNCIQLHAASPLHYSSISDRGTGIKSIHPCFQFAVKHSKEKRKDNPDRQTHIPSYYREPGCGAKFWPQIDLWKNVLFIRQIIPRLQNGRRVSPGKTLWPDMENYYLSQKWNLTLFPSRYTEGEWQAVCPLCISLTDRPSWSSIA